MQSYPSPNAVPADSQPFYASSSNQQQPDLRDAEDLQLTAQLSRGLAPMMSAGPGGPVSESQEQRGQVQGNPNPYKQSQDPHSHAGHQPSSQSPMDHMGSNQYGQSDASMAPRKRSKVSRACDECRRKKIRCDATGEPGDEQCSSCKRVQARCQFSRVPMKRGPSKGYIKELADRLNHLEGAMQASDIPVAQYFPHHESPLQRRASDDYSTPPPQGESTRKRTYSSVSGGFEAPYMTQRTPGPWAPTEGARHLPPPNSFSPQQSNTVFREPNYSPNGIQPLPQWRNPPEHPQAALFENSREEISHDRPADLSDAVVEGYFNTIHSTFPILWQGRQRIMNRLGSCPPMLRDAFVNALYATVASTLPTTNFPLSYQQGAMKASQLLTAFQFENLSSAPLSHNLIQLQTSMLLAIKASQSRTPGGVSQSVALGYAVGLAYALKLHQHKPSDHPGEEDPDSDERLSRKIWWALVIMDRWHASSTSSPVMIPEGAIVVFPDDKALLGEPLYYVTRLSIVLGDYCGVTLESAVRNSLSISPKPYYGTILKRELDTIAESFPTSFTPNSNTPLIQLCYWHLRILVNLKAQDSEPYDILVPAMHTVTQLTHMNGFASPLTFHFTLLAALALLELTEHESTRDEAEKGLNALLESPIGPSTWDTAIRDMIVRRKKWDSSVVAPIANPLSTAESEQAAVAAQGLQHLADLATSRDIPMTGDERKEEEKTSSGPAGVRFKRPQPLRELIRDGYLGAVGDAGR